MANVTSAEMRKRGLKPSSGQVPAQPKARTMLAVDYAPYRSRWEREYAERLALHRIGGLIQMWYYEPMRFKLADGAWYKPDFMWIANDGQIHFDEVKGFERPAAILRWKVAAELYPMFKWRMLTKRDGSWIVTRER
jgi:hypothetical protein